MPASTRIPCNSPMDRDQLPRTTASPKPATLLLRLKPGGPVVQWPRLRRRQFSDLRHTDCFPTELADAGCCLRLRSVWRLLRLLTDRLSRNNRRRRNTQNSRHSTSVKYRINFFRPLPAAALWQFGGYGENNASNGAYQFGVAPISRRGARMCSRSTPSTAMSPIPLAEALAPGSNNAFGMARSLRSCADAHGDALKQYRRDVRGQIHDGAAEAVRRLRILSIYGAQRSADRLHGYRGNLSLPGLRGVQQHEYQQCGLWRERPW